MLQNEPISLMQAIGGAIILTGIWVARPRNKTKAG
jgi:hypothetical protein